MILKGNVCRNCKKNYVTIDDRTELCTDCYRELDAEIEFIEDLRVMEVPKEQVGMSVYD